MASSSSLNKEEGSEYGEGGFGATKLEFRSRKIEERGVTEADIDCCLLVNLEALR
jgi:hypothetical protein